MHSIVIYKKSQVSSISDEHTDHVAMLSNKLLSLALGAPLEAVEVPLLTPRKWRLSTIFGIYIVLSESKAIHTLFWCLISSISIFIFILHIAERRKLGNSDFPKATS